MPEATAGSLFSTYLLMGSNMGNQMQYVTSWLALTAKLYVLVQMVASKASKIYVYMPSVTWKSFDFFGIYYYYYGVCMIYWVT